MASRRRAVRGPDRGRSAKPSRHGEMTALPQMPGRPTDVQEPSRLCRAATHVKRQQDARPARLAVWPLRVLDRASQRFNVSRSLGRNRRFCAVSMRETVPELPHRTDVLLPSRPTVTPQHKQRPLFSTEPHPLQPRTAPPNKHHPVPDVASHCPRNRIPESLRISL